MSMLHIFRNLKNTQVIACLETNPSKELINSPHGYRPPTYRPDHWRLLGKIPCENPKIAHTLLLHTKVFSFAAPDSDNYLGLSKPNQAVDLYLMGLMKAFQRMIQNKEIPRSSLPLKVYWERLDWPERIPALTKNQIQWPDEVQHFLSKSFFPPPSLERISEAWKEPSAFYSPKVKKL